MDPRWAAVVARDHRADGAFFYSVETTGVYCRPSCGSRLANPKNVRFHETAADAARAGFRPCRRCRPDQPTLEQLHAARVADACRMIETAEEMPTLAVLANGAGLSPCVSAAGGDSFSEPDADFTGGEFVLTEQRPRMQSRAEVVPLRRGDGVVFAVRNRPVQGTRGVYR